MDLRPVGTISRIHIDNMIKTIYAKTQNILVAKTVDYTNCSPSCKYKNKNDILHCSSKCSQHKMRLLNNETLDTPHILCSEELSFDVPSQKKLSKYQILQFLLYHYLPLTKEGEFKFALEKDIAEKLNCSVKTVKRNNTILQAFGLISFRYEDIGIFSVTIENYQDSFIKKGKGGLAIPLNMFEEMLSFKSIDELRISLAVYKEHVSKASFYGEDYESTFPLRHFKKLLSKGKRYAKRIYSTIDKIKDLFFSKRKDRLVKIKLKDEFNHKNYKNEFMEQALKEIMDILEENSSIKTTNKDIDDMIALSLQYGKDIVQKSLLEYLKCPPLVPEKIGATIRNLIKNSYLLRIDMLADIV